nr:Uncharacterised protein [Salmonella sp. NCTC 7297]
MFMTPASPAMIVTIAPAFPITAFICFSAYPSRDDSRYHGATSDFYAIHNGCASNPDRASDRRPSSYRNHRDRQSVILLRQQGDFTRIRGKRCKSQQGCRQNQ